MKGFYAVTLLALPLGALGMFLLPLFLGGRVNFRVAISITSPTQGTTWNSTGEHTVTWTSVS
jgi:hypothetical protein